jgi:hypothetical protein
MDTGIPDFKKCHGGEREKCCAYLMMGTKGFECGRGTSFELTIRERVKGSGWTAKRMPVKPWPECYEDKYDV